MLMTKCPKCKAYTLDAACKSCKVKTKSAHPPRFSLEKEEKYGKYRRLSEAKV